MDIDTIAAGVAHDIFATGDEVHQCGRYDRVQRIAFKGGSYPGAETELGGLCEESLARKIAWSLRRQGFSKDTKL